MGKSGQVQRYLRIIALGLVLFAVMFIWGCKQRAGQVRKAARMFPARRGTGLRSREDGGLRCSVKCEEWGLTSETRRREARVRRALTSLNVPSPPAASIPPNTGRNSNRPHNFRAR